MQDTVTADEIIEVLDLCHLLISQIKPDSPLLESIPTMKARLAEVAHCIDEAKNVRNKLAGKILVSMMDNHELVQAILRSGERIELHLPRMAVTMARQIIEPPATRIPVTDVSQEAPYVDL